LDLLADHKGVEVRYSFGKLYPHVVFCIWYFVFVAAYLENAVSRRYVDENRNSFFKVTLEMSEKFIRGMIVYLAKPYPVKCQPIRGGTGHLCTVGKV
jgi:hypothetical protein